MGGEAAGECTATELEELKDRMRVKPIVGLKVSQEATKHKVF